MPVADSRRESRSAGELGQNTACGVLQYRPRTLVADPKIVSGLVALGPGLGIGAPEQLDSAALLPKDVDIHAVVRPRSIPDQRERFAVGLPLDRPGRRHLLNALAPSIAVAGLDFKGTLHIRQILCLRAD